MQLATTKQEAPPSLADQFSKDLEILSKRLGVAFVAEGEPFPQTASVASPSLNASLAPEEAVKEVADYFDYAVLRQGNVYLLTKRYTNPEDMPDVTPEECHNGLQMLALAMRTGRYPPNKIFTMEGGLAYQIVHLPRGMTHPTMLERLTSSGLPCREMTSDWLLAWGVARKYYLLAAHDRVEATLVDLDKRPPLNPYFHWKTIGKSRLFGYGTFMVDFIPLRDLNRILVPSRTSTIPRPWYVLRDDINVLEQDLSDPGGLSEQTRRALDEADKSSHVVTLKQAIALLNMRKTNSAVYGVDTMYAPKHVILVGMESLSPEVAMQSLAAVYGLRLARRLDGAITLTPPMIFYPYKYAEDHYTDHMVYSVIPAPIYRAFRARTAAGHPGRFEDVRPGAQQEPDLTLTPEQFEEAGAKMQNTAARLLRYLAEPQVLAQPGKQQMLSALGKHARNLFAFARTVPAFADACGLADCVVPPYVTDQKDFEANVTLWGQVQGAAFPDQRVSLSLVYKNPQTGKIYGPILFFDGPVPLELSHVLDDPR